MKGPGEGLWRALQQGNGRVGPQETLQGALQQFPFHGGGNVAQGQQES